MVAIGWVVFIVDLIPSEPWIPRSVPLTGTLVALMLAVAARAAMRAYRERLTVREPRLSVWSSSAPETLDASWSARCWAMDLAAMYRLRCSTTPRTCGT